ncbi:hypothetical protein L7F22_054180 [Adiantum nelumboides]|nr:hypothetical protein [Adiantum nelumboides]
MHRVYEGEDFDDTLEDLDGTEDYLSDKREEEEEEELDIFLRLVAVAVLQHALVARRRLIFDLLGSTRAGSRELTNAVAGVDIAGGLQALVETAQRAEKRFGVSLGKAAKRSSKEKKKSRTKKKKRSDDSDSDTDMNLKTDTDSDLKMDSNGDMCLTPKLVFKVFTVPYLSVAAKGRKVTDSQMKGEFGNPIGAKAYYMVRNAGGIIATNLFWYVEKVCILQKTAYMSKGAFAPIFQVERGIKVDWATLLYDRMQLTGKRDRRQTPTMGQEAPYLAAIFEHAPKVKPVASSLKTSAVDALTKEGTLRFGGAKLNFSTMGSESKGKKITLFPKGTARAAGKSVSESLLVKGGSSASHETMGIFFVEEATNYLADLNKFLQNQDEVLRVLEIEKLEHTCSAILEGEMQKVCMQLLQEKSNKERLQRRLTPLADMEKAVLQGQGMTDVLVANLDEDALKKEVLEYAHEIWNRATRL